MPGPLLATVGTERLRSSLDSAAKGTDSCYIVNGPQGRVVESDAATPRIPASTLKLLTATAALDVLGADFTFETKAVAGDKPRDGEIERLWLVGSGDPMIATPEGADRLAADPLTKGDATTPLVKLADDIVAAGVKSIPGGVVGRRLPLRRHAVPVRLAVQLPRRPGDRADRCADRQ